jgi:uncharacterized protein (DUF58 family)
MREAAAEYAEVLDAVRGIGWPARRRASTSLTGPHPSTARGGVAEFIEYRPYRQGDDTRRIDWKLVARTDRVFARLSLDSTTLPTIIILDASASMDFPEGPGSKWAAARRLAIGLAAMARDRGDPVGLIVSGAAGEKRVPLSTRRNVLAEMAAALEVRPEGSPPGLPAVSRARETARRLVVIGDFLGDAEQSQSALAAWPLAGGELYALHIIAVEELDPPSGTALLSDPESPAIRRPLTTENRREYLRAFGQWRSAIAESWRDIGAVYHRVIPGSEPIRQTMRRIVALDRSPAAR